MRVTALNFYPVKSCKGTPLNQAVIGKRGIVNDRILMVVDAENRFMTQREHPRMALIAPKLEGKQLRLSGPDIAPLTIDTTDAGPRAEVTVWRDQCTAVDQGDAAARWLTNVLGTPCRLVRMADDYVRHVDQTYAPRADDQTGFADAYPLLLISEGSLEDLNSRLEVRLPMNRFRPNIVVTGCEPYAEDGWKRIRIGAMSFDVVKPCSRCAITTTDQATAERSKEPLKTLATYRKRDSDVFFGQNVVHAGVGQIHVGDRVEVLE
jgi:hypothetical protein